MCLGGLEYMVMEVTMLQNLCIASPLHDIVLPAISTRLVAELPLFTTKAEWLFRVVRSSVAFTMSCQSSSGKVNRSYPGGLFLVAIAKQIQSILHWF